MSKQDMVELDVDAQLTESSLYNKDLSPTKIEERTWKRWDFTALWIGMAVCIPTYMLAASLLNQGMNWWQAIITILIGNVIVLIPMVLNAHPGTKYGIPFPVLTRASFGTKGAHIPSVLRALVACGWFGIQTWIGGAAIYTGLKIFFPEIQNSEDMFIGINAWEFASFMFFWCINMVIILAGIESIRWLENYVAPILIAMGIALMVWVFSSVGIQKSLDYTESFTIPAVTVPDTFTSPQVPIKFNVVKEEGIARASSVVIVEEQNITDGILVGEKYSYMDEILYTIKKTPTMDTKLFIQFASENSYSSIISCDIKYSAEAKSEQEPQQPNSNFWVLFFPLLTAIIGFWATLSLNIPDFTRYASSQKEHLVGQFVGLPPTMAFYSFIGLIATSAGVLLFSDILIAQDAPWDPVVLLAKAKQPIIVLMTMLFIAIATLSTNLAANVVAPANGFANMWPEKISFKWGGVITGVVGILICPWKLIESTQGYIFVWLIGYSALLGPIAGIVICDYYLFRKTKLALADLYKQEGKYKYSNGINWIAIIALVCGILPNIPGFLATSGFISSTSVLFQTLYTYAWFVGFFISGIMYTILMHAFAKDKK